MSQIAFEVRNLQAAGDWEGPGFDVLATSPAGKWYSPDVWDTEEEAQAAALRFATAETNPALEGWDGFSV